MNQVRFDDCVAIVTGSGRGIGRECALLLASRGAKVVVNDTGGAIDGTGEDAAPCQTVVQEIKATGGKAVACTSSVVDGADSIVKTAIDNFGRVDIIINNAGIFGQAPFEEFPDDLRDRHFDVHVKGSWNVTRAAWPHMKQQGYGRVVMIVSSAGLFGMPDAAAYCTAKGALVGLTRALALEGANHGIHVNGVNPGGNTRMIGQLPEDYRAWAEIYMKASLSATGICFLGHRDCQVTGQLFGSRSGRMGSYFIADTAGFCTNPDEFTLEAIRDNWDQITAHDKYHIPGSVADDGTYINSLINLKETPSQATLQRVLGNKKTDGISG